MPYPLALAQLHKLFLYLALVCYAYSLIWVFRDARRRGESGLAMMVGVALFFWPLGLIGWLFSRPPVRYRDERPLVHRRSAGGGGGAPPPVDDDFIF